MSLHLLWLLEVTMKPMVAGCSYFVMSVEWKWGVNTPPPLRQPCFYPMIPALYKPFGTLWKGSQDLPNFPDEQTENLHSTWCLLKSQAKTKSPSWRSGHLPTAQCCFVHGWKPGATARGTIWAFKSQPILLLNTSI